MPRLRRRWRSPARTQRRARELRGNPTKAEALVWYHLRRAQLGPRFRRQHPLGPFVVDFCCVAAGLVVELDGGTHEERYEYDCRRTRWLQARGYRVMRFDNDEVYRNLEGVIDAIRLELRRSVR